MELLGQPYGLKRGSAIKAGLVQSEDLAFHHSPVIEERPPVGEGARRSVLHILRIEGVILLEEEPDRALGVSEVGAAEGAGVDARPEVDVVAADVRPILERL